MQLLQLTQGYQAKVDDWWYPVLIRFSWCADVRDNKIYALSRTPVREGIRLHQLVSLALSEEEVDHIDGDGLNYQYYNLRICTRQQNLWNMKKKGATSRFIGVSWNKGGWLVQLRDANGYRHRYWKKDEIEAAKLYNELALKYHGEFARLNEI